MFKGRNLIIVGVVLLVLSFLSIAWFLMAIDGNFPFAHLVVESVAGVKKMTQFGVRLIISAVPGTIIGSLMTLSGLLRRDRERGLLCWPDSI